VEAFKRKLSHFFPKADGFLEHYCLGFIAGNATLYIRIFLLTMQYIYYVYPKVSGLSP